LSFIFMVSGIILVALALLSLWGMISVYQYVAFFRNNPPFLLVPVGILLPIVGYVEYVMLLPIGFGVGMLWLFLRYRPWIEH